MTFRQEFDEVDRLVSEQKLQAALEVVQGILAKARETRSDAAWTRALIREVQLRSGLSGFEGAAEFLAAEPRPETPSDRALLKLFEGQALVNYLDAYSWEINQRERVASSKELDLKSWTADQIFDRAQGHYAEVWRERAAWGEAPLGELAEYIEQNSYPPRIRGTLRDAVSYLWAELLADSSHWRPGQQESIYKLSLPGLLEATPDSTRELELASPDVHPLAKINAILLDLEHWHRAARRPEAAHEAYLQRVLKLWEHFTVAEDRARLLAGLSRASRELGRSYEWWSMGEAVRAELVQQGEDPNRFVDARAIARAAAEAHPDSPGGKRAAAIVATIEAPAFELNAMMLDGARQRSILVTHKNLERLYFRAYRRDLLRAVEGSKNGRFLADWQEVQRLVAGGHDARWSLDLPATPDFQLHGSYVTPPLPQPGQWVIVASAREDFAAASNQLRGLNLIVSELVVLTHRAAQDQRIEVVSGADGRALAGVEVRVYRLDYERGIQLVESKVTDENGSVRLARGTTAGQARRNFQAFVTIARRGDDVSLGSQFYETTSIDPDTTHESALLYTDRSVYRPLQEIHWKVVAYRALAHSARSGAPESRFEIQPGSKQTITLVDPNGEVAATETVTTNAFGSASGSFRIPAGRLLGEWSLNADGRRSTALLVEEYKRPTFEVEINEPAEPLRLNRPARLAGSARYYFGLPVSSGEVSWRVTREPVFPRWWYGYWPGSGQRTETLAAGTSRLQPDGRFEIELTPEADERLAKTPGLSYRFRLSADVTDEGGETRSGERSFRLGFVAVEANLALDRQYLTAGEPTKLEIRRSDLDGVPAPGTGSYRLLRLEGPAQTLTPAEQPLPPAPPGTPQGFQTPGDALRPRWAGESSPEAILRLWQDGAELARGALQHDDKGLAALALPPLAAGAYRLRYETRDPFGATSELQQELLVGGGEAMASLSLPVVLKAERFSAAIGETARFLVHSGFPDQPLTLEIVRGDGEIEKRAFTGGTPRIVEVKVEGRDRGGLSVRLAGVRDHQLLRAEANVFVLYDDRMLSLELATFRDRLRPGTKETFRVTLRGKDAKTLGKGAAEVLAYMYDKSLDFFAPHTVPEAPGLFLPKQWLPGLESNLGSAGIVWQGGDGFPPPQDVPVLRPDRLKFFDDFPFGGPGVRRFALAMKVGAADTGMAPPAPRAAPAEAQSVESLGYVADASRSEPPPPPPPPPPPAPSPELRSDFAETAFWYPHLLTGDEGAVAFEFTVPDSVTEWNLWVHALTRDFALGSLNRQTRTVKELLVRPYVPRFLREGDEAAIEVVVNNAGERAFTGELTFEIRDPETDEDLAAAFGLSSGRASFSVEPGKGSTHSFAIRAPRRLGTVAFRVVGRAGDFSDGELRPLPVLPSRLHLAQSRFVALSNKDRRELVFADMAKADDPSLTHDQLVITLDAQLFYSVLSSLPYLIDYPYECSEQTMNRFLSTGIVASLFDRYPAVERMARQFANERDTRLESWAGDDPNRKMALEESPWLSEARGTDVAEGTELLKALDPEIARAQRASALAKLESMQLSSGAFPWFPGGPPSPYITLYLAYGFSKATEMGVEVPQPMVARAWGYLKTHFEQDLAVHLTKDECCWETVTFLNYVLSNYPDASWTGGVFSDDDRRRLLDFSFRHWKKHSPLLKSYLAMTLARAGRKADARLVFDSVMDSAKTTPDEGTFWQPEDRAWLWYNDSIEGHALALRALTELDPADARRHGLVQWLMLNKKLNHWKSTRSTAEVIYALVHYLEKEGTLASREAATVTAGPLTRSFVFEPDRYTGKKNQIVIPGPEVNARTQSRIVVEKETPGLLFASATWHFSTDRLPTEAEGDFFRVERRFFRRVHDGREWTLEPLAEGARLAVGDELEVQLSIRARQSAEYVHLRDPRGAGFEPVQQRSGYQYDLGLVRYEEVRDSGNNFFFEWLPAGEYTLKYRLRAAHAGSFRTGPATLQSMYAPEFNAYSSGELLRVATE